MDFAAAVARVLSLWDLERLRTRPTERPRYDLSRMVRLLALLDDPHERVPVVHVTGTKGKGSVAAMLEAILLASGRRVGLYTSPHLNTIRERIRLDQEPISERGFVGLVERLWPIVEAVGAEGNGRVTTFELLTAMAMVAFADRDIAVLEVGLGGRLDATNVVSRPLVAIITAISLEHSAILGNTVAEIAADKAGIIKAGRPAVTAPQEPSALAEIRRAAAARAAPLVEVGRDDAWERRAHGLDGQEFVVRGPEGAFAAFLPLLGRHQLENAAVAIAACRAMRATGVELSDDTIRDGLRRVRWPGRLEVLRRDPLVVVDGAHNPHSAAVLRDAVADYLAPRRVILVAGVLVDKDYRGIAAALAPIVGRALVAPSRHPRARAAADLAAAFRALGVPADEHPSLGAATRVALDLTRPGDLVLGTGSLATVGEVREEVLGLEPELYPH